MCRIVGIWDFNYKGNYDLEKTLIEMRDTMIYGGPDDSGIFVESKIGIGLAHRRLSILDLSSAGHQPMSFENLTIVYNGEVYNFKEIRETLKKYGYSFWSDSDTEVVLKAFHRWGLNSVKKFRGMWAFAIWDRKNEKLILCRDRIGVKPLYFYFKDGKFIFSSEIKAILKSPFFSKKIDQNAVFQFLQYGYIPNSQTVFQDIYRIEPGSLLVIDKNGNIGNTKYWNVYDIINKDIKINVDEQKTIKYVEEKLLDAFKYRLVADVPVGIYFSGGIDSSLVTVLLQKYTSKKIKTFTIGFSDKRFDESKYARDIANYLGTEHYEILVKKEDYLSSFYEIIPLMDDPISDDAFIPTYILSKFAKKYVKVVLSADGGDEIFGGYKKYVYAQKIYKYKPLIGSLRYFINKYIGKPNFNGHNYTKLLNAIVAFNNNLCELNANISKFISYKYLKETFLQVQENIKNNICSTYSRTKNNKDNRFFTYISIYDFLAYLPNDLLIKTDRATMYNSIEGREPFLDNILVETGLILPDNLKVKNKKNKYILRKILEKNLPRNLFDRKKHGFNAPVYSFFKKEIESMIENEYELRKFFNIILNKTLDYKEFKYLKDRISNTGPYFKWNLYVLYLWSNIWIGK